MENMALQVVFAQLINGIAIGSIYGLLTTGLNLLLVVCGVWHYAYPYVVVFSMYLAWLVHRNTGNIFLTLATAFISGIVISLITEPLFRPLSKKSEGAPIGTFILSTGILVILADLMNNVFIRLGFTAGSVVGFPQIAGSFSIAIWFILFNSRADYYGGWNPYFCRPVVLFTLQN